MKPSKDFYKKKKLFTIYALMAEDDGDMLAFIGKTSSRDLNAVLRRHLRGEVLLTKNNFSKGASTGEPYIIPLENIESTEAVAYQHLLCWYRILDEKGDLMTMNPMATDAQAYNMSPSTERIYRAILATTPIDDILSGKASPVPATLEKLPESSTSERTMAQMNIRVEENDRVVFYRLCKENHMSQREGFLHLLTLSPLISEEEKHSAIDRLLREKDGKIVRQAQAISELERKLTNKSRGQAADEKLKKALLNTESLIKKYIDLTISLPNEKPLSCLSFNMWDQAYGPFTSYDYPETVGCSVMKLESMSYGKGTAPAVFLYGTDFNSGKRIKFRYYPRRYTLGFSPKNPYATPGSLWYVHHNPTSDGAADVGFLLPLPRETDPRPRQTEEGEKPPLLEDVIARIEAGDLFS